MMASELIERLQQLVEDNDDEDIDVRFAQQPSWPFEYSISPDIALVDLSEEDDETGKHIYLAEGNQLGYLPAKVAQELGW